MQSGRSGRYVYYSDCGPLTSQQAVGVTRLFYILGTIFFIVGVIATPVLGVYAIALIALGAVALVTGILLCIGGCVMGCKAKSLYMQERITGIPTRTVRYETSNELTARMAISLARVFGGLGIAFIIVGVVATPLTIIYFFALLALGVVPLGLGVIFSIIGLVMYCQVDRLKQKEATRSTFANEPTTVSGNVAQPQMDAPPTREYFSWETDHATTKG